MSFTPWRLVEILKSEVTEIQNTDYLGDNITLFQVTHNTTS